MSGYVDYDEAFDAGYDRGYDDGCDEGAGPPDRQLLLYIAERLGLRGDWQLEQLALAMGGDPGAAHEILKRRPEQ